MAKCSSCGNSSGLLSRLCDKCKEVELHVKNLKESAEQEAKLARISQQKLHDEKQSEEKKSRITALVTERDNFIASAVNAQNDAALSIIINGGSVNIFESIYIEVDSTVNSNNFVDEFNIGSIKKFGLNGWDFVSAIPRTVGVGLSNSTGPGNSSWGGGMGGNVAGVHVIFRKSIDQRSINTTSLLLKNHIQDNIFNLLNESEVKFYSRLQERIVYAENR
jgi:hypothetical protein